MAFPELWTTCLSRQRCTERATSEHASGVLSRDQQPTCSHRRHALRRPSLLSYCAPFLFVSGLIFYFASCLRLPFLRLHFFCLSRNAAALPGYREGEREKKVCFYFLVIVFLHKMNKVNIFYYTEQQKVFFFT